MDRQQRKTCGKLCSRRGSSVLFSGVCCAALVCCAGLSACGKAVPRHTTGIWVGDQGGGSEVVFDSPTVLAAMDRAREDGRVIAASDPLWKDRMLSFRPPESAYDQGAWPDARRPSLERSRRIYFNQRTDTYLFFLPETPTRSRDRGTIFYP